MDRRQCHAIFKWIRTSGRMGLKDYHTFEDAYLVVNLTKIKNTDLFKFQSNDADD